MPVVTVYLHGVTAGVAPMNNNHKRAPRGEVKGWSPSTVRRNLAFLRSIDDKKLTGEGWAITLTCRNCPATHDDWHKAVELYLLQVKRIMGTIRVHTVTEWQRRGVPHLHGAIWFPDTTSHRYDVPNILTHLWFAHGAAFGVGQKGQIVKPIDAALGWFQYVSKHAARGVSHYQRSSQNIPSGWVKTGRMWSKGGAWPIKEPLKLTIENSGYHILRRWVRAWRKSDARTALDNLRPDSQRRSEFIRRVKSARRMLRCSDLKLSGVRGVSEWIPEYLLLRMIERLHLDGYQVQS